MKSVKDMEPHERLMRLRTKAGFMSASDAARAFGWNENTYRSHENGERGIRPGVSAIYERALKAPSGYILLGLGETSWNNRVAISGSIGKNGIVSYYQDDKTIFADIAMLVDNIIVAYEVNSDTSLFAFQPGDLILAWGKEWKLNGEVPQDWAIVDTINNEILLRKIRIANRNNRFHLDFPLLPTEIDVLVTRVSPVHAIIPRGQWSKRDSASNTILDNPSYPSRG